MKQSFSQVIHNILKKKLKELDQNINAVQGLWNAHLHKIWDYISSSTISKECQ